MARTQSVTIFDWINQWYKGYTGMSVVDAAIPNLSGCEPAGSSFGFDFAAYLSTALQC